MTQLAPLGGGAVLGRQEVAEALSLWVGGGREREDNPRAAPWMGGVGHMTLAG